MQTYWDFQRGQILISGWNAVHAFDLQTGVERYRFGHCSGYTGCSFNVIEDNTVLLVLNNGGFAGRWNLDTLECSPGPRPWGYFTCSAD